MASILYYAIPVFILLILVNAIWMDRIARKHGHGGDADGEAGSDDRAEGGS